MTTLETNAETELESTTLELSTLEHGSADPICAAAVDLARAAAIAEAGDSAVGEHLGVIPEGETVATHLFDCTMAGYVGWQWQVSTTRAHGTQRVTVSEVSPAPTTSALLAPEWVPWTERIKPGDLSSGTVVPTADDDPRLQPGWSGADDLAAELDPGPLQPVCWEPGLGRKRVPSPLGRTEAAIRWHRGEAGPNSAMARSAPADCASCGWMLTIGGPLGQMFGVCSNALSPSDGHVVAFDHGCGGHSDAPPVGGGVSVVDVVMDEVSNANLEYEAE
ncbi:MAG: DUF3027 domain-containing protein [Actinomycetia bacterium]|nr:DUF3027 domain-containing protein [Actinomycetes bacterium]